MKIFQKIKAAAALLLVIGGLVMFVEYDNPLLGGFIALYGCKDFFNWKVKLPKFTLVKTVYAATKGAVNGASAAVKEIKKASTTSEVEAKKENK